MTQWTLFNSNLYAKIIDYLDEPSFLSLQLVSKYHLKRCKTILAKKKRKILNPKIILDEVGLIYRQNANLNYLTFYYNFYQKSLNNIWWLYYFAIKIQCLPLFQEVCQQELNLKDKINVELLYDIFDLLLQDFDIIFLKSLIARYTEYKVFQIKYFYQAKNLLISSEEKFCLLHQIPEINQYYAQNCLDLLTIAIIHGKIDSYFFIKNHYFTNDMISISSQGINLSQKLMYCAFLSLNREMISLIYNETQALFEDPLLFVAFLEKHKKLFKADKDLLSFYFKYLDVKILQKIMLIDYKY